MYVNRSSISCCNSGQPMSPCLLDTAPIKLIRNPEKSRALKREKVIATSIRVNPNGSMKAGFINTPCKKVSYKIDKQYKKLNRFTETAAKHRLISYALKHGEQLPNDIPFRKEIPKKKNL